jgi:ureidoacrylate peracid hydrolase
LVTLIANRRQRAGEQIVRETWRSQAYVARPGRAGERVSEALVFGALLVHTYRRRSTRRKREITGREMMDPKSTAVVLIEYQNDFTTEGGTLHQAVKPVMDKTNMLANTVDTVKKARELGATIVYAPISFTDDYHELSPTPYGILKGVVDSKSFRQGTWGAQIVDVLKPEAGDIVIEGKRGLDGFATTNLDFILRGRGISTIALGGFLTNCCVESTMRTGYEKGYDVITLKDCTATVSEEEQQAAVEKNYPMFSKPMTHDEFLSSLKSGKAVETKSRGYEAA